MGEFALAINKDADLAPSLNGLAYRAKSFLNVKHELASLSEKQQGEIAPILRKTGCWDALQFKPGEKELVVPIECG